MNKELWNKCDICGRIIPFKDFESGLATREMITPDSEFTSEDWETLCKKHNKSNKTSECIKEG